MPSVINHNGVNGLPSVGRGVSVVKSFNDGTSPVFPERNLRISGITKDSAGVALGNCRVLLIETPTNLATDDVVSDSSGNYITQIPKGFSQSQTTTWRCVAYKSGSPDVTGTTRNDLLGA